MAKKRNLDWVIIKGIFIFTYNVILALVNLVYITVLFIIKIPYYLGIGIMKLFKSAKAKSERGKIEKNRGNIRAMYESFEIVKKETGDVERWEKNLSGKSKIGIILGARGSGKSAFGIKLLENIYVKTKRKCYAMGFKRDEMPSWMEVVENIEEIENDAFVLIDEGGVLFSSRRAMTNANKILGDLILISRHKNLTIIFISQNSSNLDVNIIRQADFLVLKPSSLLQKDFERKIIKELYDKTAKDFGKYKEKTGITYLYSDDFKGFIVNKLPSFWSDRISRSFR